MSETSPDKNQSLKDFLSKLVLEYYPPDKPIYGSLTGREMAKEIQNGTEIGRKYSSDLLRVCRDLLARQAQNKHC